MGDMGDLQEHMKKLLVEATLTIGGKVVENHSQASAKLIVAEVRRLGCEFELAKTTNTTGKIKIHNASKLPDALLELVKKHKREIVEYLTMIQPKEM